MSKQRNDRGLDQIQNLLKDEQQELVRLEETLEKSLTESDFVTKNVNEKFNEQLSFGDRLSDQIADFGGSWTFILAFMGICALWIGLNSWRASQSFDPYPFILLNLVLSCVAALQAPLIMMSQNRQEDKDRLRAEHDYKINLQAELEVRQLHMKIDQLLKNQWHRLLEIQKVQTEMLSEMLDSKRD